MNSYLAEFAFVQKGSGIRKNGSAWYNHVGGRWRLSYFKYDREIVYAGDE